MGMDQLLDIRDFQLGYINHWIYVDNGNPVMIIARYNQGNKKTYRQFCLQDSEWVEGMPPSPYPLYGLDSLKNNSSKTIFIVEGEKCASVLHQLKWPAVSNVLGASNVTKSNWLPLRYYTDFIILRDNDTSGIAFTKAVSAELLRINPNAKIFAVNLTPNISGGDLVDWLTNTLLLGQEWDGFSYLDKNLIPNIQKALEKEIDDNKINVEECPQVAFKKIEALFEGPPKPFNKEFSSVPDFPLEVFPKDVQEFISLTSKQFSQTPDFAGTTFIASIGGLIGRSIHLQMQEGNPWKETANCWAMLVGQPSAKKSPIMRRIFSLFKPLEKKAGIEFIAAKKEYKQIKDMTGEDFEGPIPIRKRYITDDITTPKLRELMAGNPKGIILRNDELKGQLKRLEKVGNEGDRSFMMSCWSGLEEYSEDRMCRESLLNIPLCLTWIGCIPPTALLSYLREAISQGNNADGFMQRFQLICFPDHKKPFTITKEVISSTLKLKIEDIFNKIDEGSKDNRDLYFSNETQILFNEWLEAHENNTRFGKHPTHWESHLGKQSKPLAVLIIVIHCLQEILEGDCKDEVNEETFKKALQLLKYYESHAERCYNSISGGSSNDAETILNLIKQKRLPSRFKAHDIYHQGLGGLLMLA
ncbi:MAG: hypothetical protein AMS24_03790 [Chlamydiae bacterium SM23_39]|nr:MAG: hypothetical protein AMS24_03790 [Chlamydiae bacterium SM23_39]